MKTLIKAHRALPTLSTLAALLCFAPLAAQAQDFTCITNNGTITITRYTGPGGDVTIPDTIHGLPVTSIGDHAFFRSTTLTSVTIPDSVTSIGIEAFGECTSLTNVTIGNSVTSIGNGSFRGCSSLTTFTIPDSVTGIGYRVFSSCSSLTNVTIGNGVTSIGDEAFSWCVRLSNVTIGNSVANIGNWAFWSCRLTNVTIGNRVTSIGSGAFYACTSLTSVTIPDSVTYIGYMAFSYCTILRGVYVKGNAPSLGPDVFNNATNATVYYLAGTIGWSSDFGGRPTALWQLPYPVILDLPPSFGVKTNAFGFIVSWAANVDVAVEACTNLTIPTWSPVGTNTITTGIDPLTDGWSYFSDPDWSNCPARFYRLRSP
jgi:hypothetical protein